LVPEERMVFNTFLPKVFAVIAVLKVKLHSVFVVALKRKTTIS
jgi:hypothetical protein